MTAKTKSEISVSIKILPARLANQIAAGEVVERPASVLKELLENSIDAGANHIDIDIEKGGHKKIKITDNGSGIAKDELMLALSRHATSKVSELDDLENIMTLGFRGEALASISSVSRLTLTSRPVTQQQAWQARTEGRDMQVQLEPAAHPVGTSVEVLDLFFNTPARRKFLRTEKTEFNHIEELFHRIALSRYDVGLRLKHNGKMVKNLPAITNNEDRIKRIRQLCGNSVCDGLLQLDSRYEGFHLTGWLSAQGQFRSMNDTQFIFVNNRMMKDKLILHAIRQAYEGLLPEDKFPYFVLYLNVPCSEVDVNVHPAKHEVRFHQSRLVHDFIFSAVNEALNQNYEAIQEHSAPISVQDTIPKTVQHGYQQPEADYIAPLQPANPIHRETGSFTPPRQAAFSASANVKEAASNYGKLMTVPSSSSASIAPLASGDAQYLEVESVGLVVQQQGGYKLVPQKEILRDWLNTRLTAESMVSQPLLLPVAMNIDVLPTESYLRRFQELSIELQVLPKKVILKQVPAGTRQQNWQQILAALLALPDASDKQAVLDCIASYWQCVEVGLLQLWRALTPGEQEQLLKLSIEVPMADWLRGLQQ